MAQDLTNAVERVRRSSILRSFARKPATAFVFEIHAPFEMANNLLIGVTRSFHSFSEALPEMINARIVAGIHFRTACEDGTVLGKAVGQYVLKHAFQRVP